MLRGGTYRLTSTFQLDTRDSGGGGFDVAYVAFPGEKPVLTGARKVTADA